MIQFSVSVMNYSRYASTVGFHSPYFTLFLLKSESLDNAILEL